MDRYRVKALRIYGDRAQELITEPQGVELGVAPCTPFEAKLLDMAARGEKPSDPRIGYRLAVACIRSGCFEKRDCNTCFFRDICALPKNPEWFTEKGIIDRDTLRKRGILK